MLERHASSRMRSRMVIELNNEQSAECVHLVNLVVPVQAPHSLGLHGEAILLHSDEQLSELLDASSPSVLGRDKVVPHQGNHFVTRYLVPCFQHPAAGHLPSVCGAPAKRPQTYMRSR